MCGLTGIVSQEPITETDRRALAPMLDCLVHRGPDDGGQYVAGHAALGHRRLSIIDLETGRQPIANEAETVWAVVNGEIYNFLELRDELIARGHVFRSASDSECLVHLYEEHGRRCLDSMDGMFAFAVWDQRDRMLLLARDRLGVKPLYYHCDGTRLVFGSELKAVLAAPGVRAEIDPTSLIDYLTFSFIPAPKTIFKNIHKLPAGHLLTFRNGRLVVEQYWDLQHNGWTDEPIETISEQIWHRLKQATRPRLIADVPVGAFLSGGLDSSAVVTAMSQLARDDIVTVTCGFAEQPFDERAHAREVATLLQTQHHEELVRPDAAEIVDTLCWHFDEPFADASAIPTYYLSQQARRHVKVALSGDGGDETMAGYRRYRFDSYEEIFRRIAPRAMRRALLAPLASVYPNRPWMPRALRAAATLRNLAEDAPTAHGLSIATMDPGEARRMLDPDVAGGIDGYDPIDHVRELYHRCDAPDHLSRCQYVDIRLGLADGILTKVDRASMAHGLEVRSPMLDHRFIEYVWSIPPRDRIRGTGGIRGTAGKLPLRRAVERQLRQEAVSRQRSATSHAPFATRYSPFAIRHSLFAIRHSLFAIRHSLFAIRPSRIARRRKSGFDVPLDDWFTGPLRDRFHDELLCPHAALHEWISPDAVRRAWDLHASRRRLCGPTLWKLAMFNAWHHRFMSAAATSEAAVSTAVHSSSDREPPIPNPQSSIPNRTCTR
ncbi:MAG: asparagine synthase (glutamine-hydrolyzing) [Phycisphaerae bacterium]|nr:asparagine synthase (glutamine-hydrolyzing) [Phycisphaerae bacterium]